LYVAGNLYFANVQHEDENNQEKYTCENNLPEYNMYIEGAPVYIKVHEGELIEQGNQSRYRTVKPLYCRQPVNQSQ